jgi:hypothetical protein
MGPLVVDLVDWLDSSPVLEGSRLTYVSSFIICNSVSVMDYPLTRYIEYMYKGYIISIITCMPTS